MALPLPVDTAKELAEVNVPLSAAVRTWLLKHGKVVEPRLTTAQRTEYKECFRLMDADGSGAIDMTELQAAFKLLGIGLSKQEITEIVHEVDADGTGDVDWGEFLHIMTITMKRLSDGKGKQEGDAGYQMPFNLMATQYRRKRYMEGVMTGHSATIGNVLNELTKESSLAQLHRTSLNGNAYIGARSKRWLAATSSTAGCDWRLFVSQDGADAPSGPRKHRHALNQLHHGMSLQKQQEEEEEQQRAMQQRREQQMRRQQAQLFAYYNQYQHHDHHLDSAIQQQQQDLARQAEEDGTRPWHPLAWPPTTPPHRNTATPSGGVSGSGGGSTSGLAARLRAQTEVRPPSSGPVPMGDLLSGARDSKPKPSRQQQQQQQVQHDGGFSITRKPTSSGGLGSATGASVSRGASRQAASGTSRTHQEPVGSWGWAPQSPSRHPTRTSTATTTNSPKYTAKGARALARAGLVGGSLPSSPRPSAGPMDWSSDAFRPGTVPLMPWTGGKLDGYSRPTTAASAVGSPKASPFPGAAPLDYPASPTAALPASPGIQPQGEGAAPGRSAAGPSLLSYPAHNIAVAAAAAQRTALAVKAALEASQELQNREGQGSAPNTNHVRERAKAYERLLQSRGASQGSIPSPGAGTRPAPLHPLNRDVKPSTPSSAQVFASLPLQTTLAPLTSMTQQLPSGAGVEWQPVLSVAPLATQGSSAALQPPPDQQPSWPAQGQQAQEDAAQQMSDSQSAPAAQGSAAAGAPQQQQQAAASEHGQPEGSAGPWPQDQQPADGCAVSASQQGPHSSSGGSSTDTSPPSSMGGCAEGADTQSALFVDLGAPVHSSTPPTASTGRLVPGSLAAGSDQASVASSDSTAAAAMGVVSSSSDCLTAALAYSIPAPSPAVETGPDAPGAGAGASQEPATSPYTADPALQLPANVRLSKQPERPEGSYIAGGPGGLSLGGTAIAGTVQTGHPARITPGAGPGPDTDPAKPRHSRMAAGQAGQGRSASMVAAVPVTGRASTFKTVAANEPLGLAAHKKAWASLAVTPVPRMSFMVEVQAPSEGHGPAEHGGEGDAAAFAQAGGVGEQAQGAGSGGDVLGSVAFARSLVSKISGGAPGAPAGTGGRRSGAAAGGGAAGGSLPPGLKASVFPKSAAQSLVHSSMQRR